MTIGARQINLGIRRRFSEHEPGRGCIVVLPKSKIIVGGDGIQNELRQGFDCEKDMSIGC